MRRLGFSLAVIVLCATGVARGNPSRRAAEIVAGVNYLPFAAVHDGCYGRAFYLAMELAVQGIFSHAQYAVPDGGMLVPFPGVRWNYHVAPMIWSEGDAEPTIFDPTFSPQPLPRSRWLGFLHAVSGVLLYWGQGSTFFFSPVPGTPTGPWLREALNGPPPIPTKFNLGDIVYACRSLKGLLPYEDQPKLPSRSVELIKALEEKGLLQQQAAQVGSIAECF